LGRQGFVKYKPLKPKMYLVNGAMKASLRRPWKGPWKGEEGQDILEYALLLLMVVLAAVASISPLGASIGGLFATANRCASVPNTASCNGTGLTRGPGK